MRSKVAIPYCLLLPLAGCTNPFSLAQNKDDMGVKITHGAEAIANGWWSQIAGLGVLNWGGGILILLGGIAFVGSFVPAVGVLFPKKMAVSCLLAGIASILLFNFLTAFAWVVYIILAVGLVFLVLSYWPAIRRMSVKIAELVVRKDQDGDGVIGPKSGLD